MNNDYLHSLRDFELACALPYFPRTSSSTNPVRVLDLGAGTGRQCVKMQTLGFNVVAVDLPTSAYAAERVYPVIDYDGRSIPLLDDTVDVVFSSNVLEHVPEVLGLLRETRRILAPNGIAIHVLPTPSWRWWSTLAHFPWIIKRIFQIAKGRPFSTKNRNSQDQLGGESSRWSSLLPSQHGERGTLFTESFFFSERWWLHSFESAGFEVIRSYPIGLFYTGCMLFAGQLSIRRRQCLAGLLGSACRVYVMRSS